MDLLFLRMLMTVGIKIFYTKQTKRHGNEMKKRTNICFDLAFLLWLWSLFVCGFFSLKYSCIFYFLFAVEYYVFLLLIVICFSFFLFRLHSLRVVFLNEKFPFDRL